MRAPLKNNGHNFEIPFLKMPLDFDQIKTARVLHKILSALGIGEGFVGSIGSV